MGIGSDGKTYALDMGYNAKDELIAELESYVSMVSKETFKQMWAEIMAGWGGEDGLLIGWDEGSSSGPSHVHDFQWKTVKEPTVYANGIYAEVCSTCGERRSEQPLSAFEYALFHYAAPMIETSEPGSNVTFEFDVWNSFPRAFMEKIAQKNDVTFVFKFKYMNQNYTVCIPAGTMIDLNEDWYGPRKMEQLYGAIVE